MNKNNIITPFLCVFSGLQIFSITLVSRAAEEAAPIVVTATRTSQVADQSLTPGIVITQKDIELSQSRDVAEILRFHAGIELSRAGGPGQQTSVFIRGTESDHVIIMIGVNSSNSEH